MHAESITTDKDINYIVNGLDEKVHEGYTLLIQMDGIPADQITGVNIPNYYNFSQWDMPGLAWKGFYYFGARYYDPEVGVWLSVDPAQQDFFAYGYCAGNPIILVDSDGRVWGQIIGAVVGAYAGGVLSNLDVDNPFKPWGSDGWNWERPGTYFGVVGGAITGWKIGKGFETALTEHRTPTGNKYIDNPDIRKEMKGSINEFVKEGKVSEKGGVIDKWGDDYSVRKGKGVNDPSRSARGSIEMPEPWSNTEATYHTQWRAGYINNRYDLNYNFPAYDKAAGSPLNHTILTEQKVVNFQGGNYTMRPGTYGSWNTNYVFRSYYNRVFRHIFLAW